MKQYLLITVLLFFGLVSYGQRDSASISRQAGKGYILNETEVNVSIYPVPVRDNSFTVTSDKEISAIKITNIIGQDIFMEKYNSPILTMKIILENAKRGMYLVVITFSDNTRIVRRILVEAAG
jgi:calcineurin-like phosphoesterase